VAARHRQHGKRKAAAEKLARVDCGECGKPAGLVSGQVIYPHRRDLHAKPYWRCAACGAYVGCHDGTYKPKGTPCGPGTRSARISAHAAFDPLWRRKIEKDGVSQGEARGKAYAWLAAQLGIPAEQTHIGMFDTATALRVVAICAPYHKRPAPDPAEAAYHSIAEASRRTMPADPNEPPPW
jgi:hypothetical protein